jgi:periplasmic protein TonB
MSSLFEGEEHLEQELNGEPIAMPATGSVLLHLGLVAFIAVYALTAGLFHSNNWGGPAASGAIQVQITSALPLPNDQPPNDNVLSTERPSPAPAPPAPKAAPVVEDKAIPIQGKQAKPLPKPTPKATPARQPPPKPTTRAEYGEQAANSIPRAVQGSQVINGPVSVKGSDFGSEFPFYVQSIQRKMASVSSMQLVDPRTPKGTRSYIFFTIHRDGTVSDAEMDRASGSPSLDRECLRAAQRVDSFGPLPPAYNQSTLRVSYYCEY